jgi:hypothetical protein
MPLGATSETRLATCDPNIQKLVRAVADGIDLGDLAAAGITDLTVVCGWRGEAEQRAAFRADPPTSKLDWPDSKHNVTKLGKPCSRAVDLAPYPTSWAKKDEWKFFVLRGYVCHVARIIGIRVRFISWDGPHVELA